MSDLDALDASGAFVHHTADLIDVARFIRAGFYTEATTDAGILVNQHEAVIWIFVCCAADANFRAWRVFTVHTIVWNEVAA